MKISACAFVNRGMALGYPFVESIRSALELVDEFVVAVGPEPDGTREAIEAIGDERVRVIDTSWSPEAPRGFVYSQQTMIALYNCTGEWVLSLQGDEAIHEQDCEALRSLVERAHRDGRADAIALNYHHFYGRPDLVARGPAWYRAEARLVRMAGRKVIVPSDAQYLVNVSGRRRLRPLKAVQSSAWIYHYGWTRSRNAHELKLNTTAEYWQEPPSSRAYEQIDPSTLEPFEGTHPAAMAPWLEHSANTTFESDPAYQVTRRDKRQRCKRMIEKLTGADLSCTHFKTIKLRPES
ncbi:MAG: hypothetical protein MK101_03210 [Phycisphaerales bacterium]|nr:hypothetical protein [Phycisphaerales bacterium]